MSNSKIKTEETSENVISVLLFRFVPYWPLFLILVAICSLVAFLYLRQTKPMYAAEATILIKDEKKGVDDAKMLESLNVYASKKIVENEIVVLRSRELMKEVVNNLHLYAPVYESDDLQNASAYGTAPIAIEARYPDNLNKVKDIPLRYNKGKESVTIGEKEYPLNKFVATYYGILKFTKTPSAAVNAGKDYLFALSMPEPVAATMANRISVQPTNKISTVLALSYTDESPKRAKDVLNQLAAVYAKNTINEKNALAENTLTFIEERLNYVTKDLDSIEKTIQQYKSQQGIVDLSEQGRVFLQNVSEGDRQASNIGMQMAVLDQVERYVVSKNNKGGIVPSTLGLNDAVLTPLLQRLYNAELEYNKARQTMAENDPTVVSLSSEIESIRPAILENVRNQKNSLQASRGNLQANTNAYSSMLRTIPQKERELLEIDRQHAIKKSVYSFLLQKREETALSYSSAMADSRLIDPAIASAAPVSPKKSMYYLGAIAVALILGIGFVSGKEILTNKILFRSDIENYTKVPIAAEITSVKHKGELVVNQPDKQYISEQFRHLRAAIGLYGKVVSKKKILITSSIAGEGKSFIASNLAFSLASSGKKVVLIDADLRSPKTSLTFGLSDHTGLAEFLQGKATLKQVLAQSESNNLQVIPSGDVVSGPTELLLNGKLHDLFAQLEALYDYILIDTSPIDPVTDAYVFSEYCDKTLYVIRHGYTPKAMVKLLDDNNKVQALHNLSIVFNGVKKRGFLKGGYGFGYGFGYEYVYKDRQDRKPNPAKTSLN